MSNNLRIVILGEGDAPEAAFPLGNAPVYLGRLPENDVVLPSSTVSGRHCAVFVRSGELWVEDLGSRNGSFTENNRIRKQQRIAVGEKIRLGTNTWFRVEGELSRGGVPALVEVGTGLRWPIRRDRMRIGPTPDCDVQLPDATGRPLTLVLYGDGGGELGGESADGFESTPIPEDGTFAAFGRTFRLENLVAGVMETTATESVRYPYEVTIRFDPAPRATFRDIERGAVCEVTSANRVSLLVPLVSDLVQRGVHEQRWVPDDEVGRAVWGRGWSTGNLSVELFRLRRELGEGGFEPWCLERRAGGMRLRIARGEVR